MENVKLRNILATNNVNIEQLAQENFVTSLPPTAWIDNILATNNAEQHNIMRIAKEYEDENQKLIMYIENEKFIQESEKHHNENDSEQLTQDLEEKVQDENQRLKDKNEKLAQDCEELKQIVQSIKETIEINLRLYGENEQLKERVGTNSLNF